MAAFCTCCGTAITTKTERCLVCGTPRHGMKAPVASTKQVVEESVHETESKDSLSIA